MSKKILAFVLTLALLCGVFVGCAKKPQTPAELISLGEKYLTELDYENAVVQFLKVIEIEPKNVQAYQGAAKAYIALGRQEEAVAILERGFVATSNADIRETLDEVRPVPEPEASEPKSVIEEPEPEPEPVGTEALTPQDLEEWGLPYGTDIAGALAKYPSEEAMPLLRGLQANPTVPPSHQAIYNVPGHNVHVSIYIGSEKLANVTWLENSTEPGPKGIHMGMSMTEVLRALSCKDSAALAFAENPSPEEFDKIAQRGNVDEYLQLGNGEIYLRRNMTSAAYELYIPCLDTEAGFTIQFENGAVSSKYGSLFVWYGDN